MYGWVYMWCVHIYVYSGCNYILYSHKGMYSYVNKRCVSPMSCATTPHRGELPKTGCRVHYPLSMTHNLLTPIYKTTYSRTSSASCRRRAVCCPGSRWSPRQACPGVPRERAISSVPERVKIQVQHSESTTVSGLSGRHGETCHFSVCTHISLPVVH